MELPADGASAGHLKPHRVKRFKLSRDAQFLEKLTDVVGLYLNPPDQALVLCVDEKTQIQALDRTQPGLPMKKGRLCTMTHDYKRNGATGLFAALELLQGKVIGQWYTRHRHQEFLKFLRRLDAKFPGDVALHLVMDNYGTHKHPNAQTWIKRHPRFVCHFLPTSSSWLNLVERWFGELDQQENPPRLIRQRRRPARSHRGIPVCLERKPQALRLDRHGRIDPRKALTLPANLGKYSARMHSATHAKGEEMNHPVIYWTPHYRPPSGRAGGWSNARVSPAQPVRIGEPSACVF